MKEEKKGHTGTEFKLIYIAYNADLNLLIYLGLNTGFKNWYFLT